MARRRKKVAVIGLATFGEELAIQLELAGAEVTALDTDPAIIQDIRDHVSRAGVADGRDPDALREFGIEQCDLVVISIRRRLEMSVLIILTLQDLGVENIIALASGKDEARALRRMGVKRIVFPEQDAARREAQLILNPELSNYIELAEGYGIVEIAAPAEFIDQSLMTLDIRKRYGIMVIAVRDVMHARPFVPDPSYVFKHEDHLLIIGSNDKIKILTQGVPEAR